MAAFGVCAACDGFRFARNTATTFDVFYWLQVTNFDVRLLNSAPNGPDYVDIVGLCLHAQLFADNSAATKQASSLKTVEWPNL